MSPIPFTLQAAPVTKRELTEAKSDIIKWVAGLLLAQAAIIAALVKLLAN